MDFSSLLFLFAFLPVFLPVFLLAKRPARLLLISVANIVFIAIGQSVALLWLTAIALTGYGIGRWIQSRRRAGLKATGPIVLGVSLNVGLVLAFKLLETYGKAVVFRAALPGSGGVLVPLGLSYVTFQTVSYIIDVGRGVIPAESNLAAFAAYIMFFPKLVSGPLARYAQFRDQLYTLDPSIEDVAVGLRRVLTGVIKRVLIANQLGLVADAVFNLPNPNTRPLFAWLALVAYTLQIYFDFAGYSDVAIGLARTTGIVLPENFNFPYIAQTIGEFWRRWHITLSTWFREYVFYPLERHRLKLAGQQINLVIVFLLVGLWHGPSLTFLCWGFLHGAAVALESTAAGRWLRTLWPPLRHMYALAIIMLGWVFFRSANMDFALGFISRLFGNQAGIYPLPFSQTTPLPFVEPSFVIIAVAAVLFSLPLSQLWRNLRTRLEGAHSMLFFALQPIEDLALMGLFVLAIAAQLSSGFRPNIYASF